MNIDDLNYIEENETFKFSCKKCGNCCKNRDDILLSAYDLYRLCAGLKMTLRKFITKYCECYIGNTSQVPVIRLLPKGVELQCPFLENGKCKVHDFKPNVCSLYPLGRVSAEKNSLRYIVQDADCNERLDSHTIDEWLPNRKEAEQAFYYWNIMWRTISDFIRNCIVDEKQKGILYQTAYALLYENYNQNHDIIEQLKARAEDIESFIKKLKEYTN